MPTIACPSCQKQYKLPETARGQVASCKCGKRFRVGGAAKPASISSAKTAASKSSVAAKPPAVAAASQQSDAFWDDVLGSPSAGAAASLQGEFPATENSATAVPPSSAKAPRPSAVTIGRAPLAPAPKAEAKKAAKKKPKDKRVVWGFDWGKVGVGLVTMLGAGGFTVLSFTTTGRVNVWVAAAAVGGLFTCINGLMGEEGVW